MAVQIKLSETEKIKHEQKYKAKINVLNSAVWNENRKGIKFK